MFKKGQMLTFYALTPLHPGSGNSLSYIDLPIQRERHTGFPIIAGSGIKGVIRNCAERSWNDKDKVNKIFGSEENGSVASQVAFTDAKILFYPVRSVKGIFAWVTCPYVLHRFQRDLETFQNEKGINNLSFNDFNDENKVMVTGETILKLKDNKDNKDDKVALEEFIFEIQHNNEIDTICNEIKSYLPSEASDIKKRIAIVADNVFADLVNYAVEVRTRIKIDQIKGTAQEGALFTIELVPSEAIFYCLVLINEENELNELKGLLQDNNVIQIGGDETTGMGFVKLKMN